MQSQKRFLLETSATPVLQRIIEQIALELHERDQQSLILPLGGACGSDGHLRAIELACPDYVVIANPYGSLCSLDLNTGKRKFELISANLIFIHHESLCVSACSIEDASALLTSYQRVGGRSYHFCVEYHNYCDLRALGISNSYPVLHCTEFRSEHATAPRQKPGIGLSFVGHIVDNSGAVEPQGYLDRRARLDYHRRLNDLGHKISPSARMFANEYSSNNDHCELTPAEIGAQSFYILIASQLSLEFRSEVIKGLGEREIDIFGGDPGYLKGKPARRIIDKDSVRYHSPTKTGPETAAIYAESRISLNITALQFDQAVTNRVLDIGACGGFPLTDWKDDLERVTTVAEEISYRSIEELSHKIDYYNHADHSRERDEIARALQIDVHSKCTYGHLVDTILEALGREPEKPCDSFNIDLGCGRESPLGFIAIDILRNHVADIEADASQRLPFPSGSVGHLRAHGSLQFVSDPITAMNEIWRVSKHSTKIDITIESSDGTNALRESHHKSIWSLSSLKHYCVQYPAFLRLSRSFGFKGAFRLVSADKVANSDGESHWHVLLHAIKPSREQVCKHSLRAINMTIVLDSDQSLDSHPGWPTQLKQLLMAVARNRHGSSYCFILDHSSINEDSILAEISAAMMETIMKVPAPMSGDYPGLCLLPYENDPDRELLTSLASDRISLGDAIAQIEQATNEYLGDGMVLDN